MYSTISVRFILIRIIPDYTDFTIIVVIYNNIQIGPRDGREGGGCNGPHQDEGRHPQPRLGQLRSNTELSKQQVSYLNNSAMADTTIEDLLVKMKKQRLQGGSFFL